MILNLMMIRWRIEKYRFESFGLRFLNDSSNVIIKKLNALCFHRKILNNLNFTKHKANTSK